MAEKIAPKGTEAAKPEAPPKKAAEAIREIESRIQETILVYTARRSIGPWDIPPVYQLLSKLGHLKKLSVILQSRGGFPDDAYKIGNIIHEFAEHVTFIVPSHAKSAATLLCLSGDKILMGPISELGPTNPMMSVDERLITPTLPEFAKIATEPPEKASRQRQMAAHALRDFLIASGVLRSDGKGYDPEALSVYMSRGILNPFLLGDFERSGKIAFQYAETLLVNYMFKNRADKTELAEAAAKCLCEGYFDHGYPIFRKEAREKLNLNVEDMEDELWQSSTTLMLAYNKMMDAQNISTIVETSTAFEISHWPTPSSPASN